MGQLTAPERIADAVGDNPTKKVSFDGQLDAGEVISSITSVTATPAGLTFANEAVSSTVLTINSKSVAIGRAILFNVSGFALASSPYTCTMVVVTDSSPAQTKNRFLVFVVEGP